MSEDAADDEDWFEQGLRESDDESTAESDAEPADSQAPTDHADAGRPDASGDTDEAAGAADWSGETDAGTSTDDGGADWLDETDGTEADGAFGEGGGAFGDADADAETAFGGDEGGMFDDDFASAFDSAGGEEFSDEDFESEIPRVDIGIEGLDRMIQGGIPQRHLIVAIGSAGTGKTTFGLQFLHHGLEQGDQCVFITLEQSYEAIMDTANERGWEFDEYERADQLAVIDLDPVEMANSLDNIRGELPGLIEQFDADRLVLDSVSLLEMMYERQAKRRTEVFDFTRSLKRAGVTTFLTSEASEDNPYASRHGIIEYLTDAVFVLRYVRAETRETRMAVEILKIRDANHSRETKPYEITNEGISVYQQANIF